MGDSPDVPKRSDLLERIKRSPQLQSELRYCVPLGLPRSTFLGPDWTDEDRAYALAWADFTRDECPTCSESFAVSTNSDNQFGYKGEIIRCHACAHQERQIKKFQDEGGDTAGVMYRFTSKPG